MRPVIVFDLDDVLINNREIKKDIFTIAAQNHAGSGEIRVAYAAIRTDCFTIEKFITALSHDPTARAAMEHEMYRLFEKPNRYTFPGVPALLRSLKKTYTLILLTYGDPGFQELKFRQAQLTPWFDKVIFTKESTKEREFQKLKAHYDHTSLLVLDDSLTICSIANELGIPCIRIKKTPKNAAYYTALHKKIERLNPSGSR